MKSRIKRELVEKKTQIKIENQNKTETKYGKNNRKNYIENKNNSEKDIKTARTIERMTERTKEKKTETYL